jgi:hypothetical protein
MWPANGDDCRAEQWEWGVHWGGGGVKHLHLHVDIICIPKSQAPCDATKWILWRGAVVMKEFRTSFSNSPGVHSLSQHWRKVVLLTLNGYSWHIYIYKRSYRFQSRDSSVGIALGYGLDDRGSRVRLPAGAGNFSLHHRVQNGSGAHPTSYPMGTGGSFPGGKTAGGWSWPLISI